MTSGLKSPRESSGKCFFYIWFGVEHQTYSTVWPCCLCWGSVKQYLSEIWKCQMKRPWYSNYLLIRVSLLGGYECWNRGKNIFASPQREKLSPGSIGGQHPTSRLPSVSSSANLWEINLTSFPPAACDVFTSQPLFTNFNRDKRRYIRWYKHLSKVQHQHHLKRVFLLSYML